MQGSMFLLLLALLCRSAVATPLRTTRSTEADHANCTEAARNLLRNIKERVENTVNSTLFHGFNCTDLESVVNPNTQTAAVCQPTEFVTCSGQRNASFDKTECLKNIGEDLEYYWSRLSAYNNSLHQRESMTEISTTINSIEALQKNCPLLPKTELGIKTNCPTSISFEDRKTMCKQLKGFYVRAITMNRALGYICANANKK